MKRIAVNSFLIVVTTVVLSLAVYVSCCKASGGSMSRMNFIESYKSTPNAVLVDVRTPQEFAEGNIEGAINIDIGDPLFAEKVATLDKNTPYFIYCRSGNRSAHAKTIMEAVGITQVTELDGGITKHPELLK